MLGKTHPSLEHTFELAQIFVQTSILSADQNKLVLGGHLSTDENTDLAALAQIDTVSDQVDFAKTFSMATTIYAGTTSQNNQEIVVLANSNDKVFLLVIDSANGDLIRALPMPTFAKGSDMKNLRSAMVSIENQRVLVAIG